MNQTIVKFTACAQGAAAVAFKKAKSLVKNPRVAMVAAFLLVFTVSTFAQNTEAGIKAITTSTDSLKKYVPVVTNLCYALAGIVAIIGAISVYIKMNNEEQDVKNILVLQNAFEKARKQMKANTLIINALYDNLNFPMFAKLTLKKT
jgi:hypothetical protein